MNINKIKSCMKSFNVIIYEWNSSKFEKYDVIPYLVDCYFEKYLDQIPVTDEDWLEFVKTRSLCQWWSRCEYEIILSEWPSHKDPSKDHREKWDVHQQVLMNLELITNIVRDEVINQINNGRKRNFSYTPRRS